MSFTQAQALQTKVSEMFPYLQEVRVTRSSLNGEVYFVGLWYQRDILLTISSEHQFKNLVAFIARAACQIEVAS
jgi:hypothetical protein